MNNLVITDRLKTARNIVAGAIHDTRELHGRYKLGPRLIQAGAYIDKAIDCLEMIAANETERIRAADLHEALESLDAFTKAACAAGVIR